MKIIKVEVFRLPTANSRQNSPIGCRVYTDAGIYGDGEAGMAYGVGGSAAFGMVCDLAELVIGMDPLGTELIWETMYKKTFWGQNGGPVVFSGDRCDRCGPVGYQGEIFQGSGLSAFGRQGAQPAAHLCKPAPVWLGPGGCQRTPVGGDSRGLCPQCQAGGRRRL